MVGYGEDTNGYKLFENSTLKTFIERSVQFEEEPIPDFELAPGECSSPQHLDEVSDDSCSVFSNNSDIDMDVDDIAIYESPSKPLDSYKLQGNWSAIPKSLGRLDLNLTMLHLLVKVLLLSIVIC